MRPEPDLTGFRNSNPARSRFGEKMFWNQRTIRLMKLMASIMLSVAIKRLAVPFTASFVMSLFASFD